MMVNDLDNTISDIRAQDVFVKLVENTNPCVDCWARFQVYNPFKEPLDANKMLFLFKDKSGFDVDEMESFGIFYEDEQLTPFCWVDEDNQTQVNETVCDSSSEITLRPLFELQPQKVTTVVIHGVKKRNVFVDWIPRLFLNTADKQDSEQDYVLDKDYVLDQTEWAVWGQVPQGTVNFTNPMRVNFNNSGLNFLEVYAIYNSSSAPPSFMSIEFNNTNYTALPLGALRYFPFDNLTALSENTTSAYEIILGENNVVTGSSMGSVSGIWGPASYWWGSGGTYMNFNQTSLPSGTSPFTIRARVTIGDNGYLRGVGGWTLGPGNGHTRALAVDRGFPLCEGYGAGYNVYAYNAPLSLNTMYHLACTYDGTTMKIWVNGTVMNSSTMTLQGSSVDVACIASDPAYKVSVPCDQQPWYGLIDDFAIDNLDLSSVLPGISANKLSAGRLDKGTDFTMKGNFTRLPTDKRSVVRAYGVVSGVQSKSGLFSTMNPINLTAPFPSTNATGFSFTVNISVVDALFGVQNISVLLNGTVVNTSSSPVLMPGNLSYAVFNVTVLSPKNYTYGGMCFSGDGNYYSTISSNISLSGTPSYPGPAAPTVYSPPVGTYAIGDVLSVGWTAASSNYTISYYNISLFDGSYSLVTVLTTQADNSSYGWGTTGLSAGVYHVGVQGWDNYGQNGTWGYSADVTLTASGTTTMTTTTTTTTTTTSSTTLSVTTTSTLGQPYSDVMSVSWGSAFSTFWMTLVPTPLDYLPMVMVVGVIGFIVWYKSRSVIILAIMLMVFLTSAGVVVAGSFGIVGLIIMGVVVFAVVVAIMKIFW